MNGFTSYKEYYELITLLPTREEQSELVLAIWEYMFCDIYPENLNDAQMKIFINLKRPLDKSKTKGKNGSITSEKQEENKTKQNQNEIKMKSKKNQKQIKNKSNENQNKIKTKSHQDVNVVVNVNDNVNDNNLNIFNEDIFNYIEKNYARTLSPIEIEKIISWQKDFEKDDSENSINEAISIIKYAVDLSVFRNAKTFAYVDAILKNWKSLNFKTLQQIKEAENVHSKKNRSSSSVEIPKELFDYDWLNDPGEE